MLLIKLTISEQVDIDNDGTCCIIRNHDWLISIEAQQRIIDNLHHEIFSLRNFDPALLNEYNKKCMEMVDKINQVELKLNENYL